MKHLIEIGQLTPAQIEALIERSLYFKHSRNFPSYPKNTVAHLFYENSTRTRVSFELAANHLSMPVINLDLQSSSEKKGEVLEDTVQTLAAMGIDTFVIRHKEEEVQQNLVKKLGNAIHIINAGDGTNAHPSQAILDMVTIIEKKPRLDQLKMVIIGDVKHSRVANSFQSICRQLGVGQLVLVSPEQWQPQKLHFGLKTTNLREGIADADVVICLRVQKERLLESECIDLATYKRDYSLTQDYLAYAKADAMVMHPGPLNRGVEIESDVADGPQSFILQQVTNGVFARMAILEAVVTHQ